MFAGKLKKRVAALELELQQERAKKARLQRQLNELQKIASTKEKVIQQWKRDFQRLDFQFRRAVSHMSENGIDVNADLFNAPILTLSDEIWAEHIFPFLHPREVYLNVCLVVKRFHDISNSSLYCRAIGSVILHQQGLLDEADEELDRSYAEYGDWLFVVATLLLQWRIVSNDRVMFRGYPATAAQLGNSDLLLLDERLGNYGGEFAFPGDGFTRNSDHVGVSGTRLQAKLLDADGAWNWAMIDLPDIIHVGFRRTGTGALKIELSWKARMG